MGSAITQTLHESLPIFYKVLQAFTIFVSNLKILQNFTNLHISLKERKMLSLRRPIMNSALARTPPLRQIEMVSI